jgi:hypothetical protein
VRTIESHRASIQAKAKRTTRAGLVGYALSAGLLDDVRLRCTPPVHR